MFQTKVAEKIKTRILRSITFCAENLAIYRIMRKNAVEPNMPQTIIWRMRIAWWIPKATHTNSEDISTATVVARTQLNVNVIRTVPVLFRSVVQQHFVVTLGTQFYKRQKTLDRCLIHQNLSMFLVYEGESFMYLFIFIDTTFCQKVRQTQLRNNCCNRML
jgi:hypothetical protein